jgi:hypothetical protein
MLSFVLTNGSDISWHVNVNSADEWVPEKLPEIEVAQIAEVYADGHELDYLLRIITGLPRRSPDHPKAGRGHTWHGDMARFIYDNLT